MMLNFLGKIIIQGDIVVKTGLRIGGYAGGLKIGGVDLNVITTPEGKPYIPGSSLKGKLRSLIERKLAAENPQFWNVKDNKGNIVGHKCQSSEEYQLCPVCKIWGIAVTEELNVPTPTRLIVCDAYLDDKSITPQMKDNLELPYTEIKFETAINRLTGTALHGSLRQIERVPAGAVFKDAEMIYNVFDEEDKNILKNIFIALELLENDYLGGMGSRGYGRVAFQNIRIYWNKRENYETGEIDLIPERVLNQDLGTTPAEIVRNFQQLIEKIA
ncbi:MAG: type III-A CRISPR-associated RAMP protein Csm3 [Candidatus Aminicenantes bacterium]|nr:MAG: type III-A CRISPR-associated RAMP protein Csm3 [Candidatus Aminicenantes bacterium]